MTKQRENIIIVTLIFAIMVCMGIGYSYIPSDSRPKGNHNVVFRNLQVEPANDSISSSINGEYQDQKEVDLTLNLQRKGDSLVYYAEVVNSGVGDAILNNIKIQDITDSDDNVAPITYTVEGLSKGAIIKSGEKASFTITVHYENDDEVVEKAVTKRIRVSVNCDNVR